MNPPPVLIIGAGAVGSTLAAFFSGAGIPVTLLVRPSTLPEYQAVTDLRLSDANGKHDQRHFRPACIDTLVGNNPYQWVFMCCKQTELINVLNQVGANILPAATLVSCLNGTDAEGVIQQMLPDHQVESLTIMFNAQLRGRLQAHLTTKPIVEVGLKTSNLLPLLKLTGLSVAVSSSAAVWGKLLINLNNALGALSHTTFKDMLCDPDLKVVYITLVDEAVEVYKAAGIKYTLPFPLPYSVYRQLILRGGPLPWYIAKLKNGLTEDAYPSMVADVLKGRETEIDSLNGKIVALGKRYDVTTPVNEKVVALVKALRGSDKYAANELRANLFT